MKKIYLSFLLLIVTKIAPAQEKQDPEMDGSCPRSRTQKNKQSTDREVIQKKATSIVLFYTANDLENLNRMIEKQKAENREANQPAEEKPSKRKFKGRCDE